MHSKVLGYIFRKTFYTLFYDNVYLFTFTNSQMVFAIRRISINRCNIPVINMQHNRTFRIHLFKPPFTRLLIRVIPQVEVW